MTRLRIYWRI